MHVLERIRLSCGGAVLALLIGHITGLTPHGHCSEWIASGVGFALAFAWLGRTREFLPHPKPGEFS